MMAAAATGKMTPEEAVAWADKQIHDIYKKWWRDRSQSPIWAKPSFPSFLASKAPCNGRYGMGIGGLRWQRVQLPVRQHPGQEQLLPKGRHHSARSVGLCLARSMLDEGAAAR